MTPSDVAQLYRNQGREIPAEFRQVDTILQGRPRGVEVPREKYGRKKVTLDGREFDSSIEAEAWQILDLWGKAGIIIDLEVQPEFQLEPKFQLNGKTIRAIKYRADFIFVPTIDGHGLRKRIKTVVDVKGFPTPAFLIKAKLFKARFPQVDFQLWDRAKVKDLSRC
jgi:Protein of unknown function (DUF1064)